MHTLTQITIIIVFVTFSPVRNQKTNPTGGQKDGIRGWDRSTIIGIGVGGALAALVGTSVCIVCCYWPTKTGSYANLSAQGTRVSDSSGYIPKYARPRSHFCQFHHCKHCQIKKLSKPKSQQTTKSAGRQNSTPQTNVPNEPGVPLAVSKSMEQLRSLESVYSIPITDLRSDPSLATNGETSAPESPKLSELEQRPKSILKVHEKPEKTELPVDKRVNEQIQNASNQESMTTTNPLPTLEPNGDVDPETASKSAESGSTADMTESITLSSGTQSGTLGSQNGPSASQNGPPASPNEPFGSQSGSSGLQNGPSALPNGSSGSQSGASGSQESRSSSTERKKVEIRNEPGESKEGAQQDVNSSSMKKDTRLSSESKDSPRSTGKDKM